MSRRLRLTGIIIVALLVVVAVLVGGLLLTAPAPHERDGWVLGPEVPRAFGELATASVMRGDGTESLIALSGLAGLGRVVDDVFIYDVASGAWRRGPSLPAAVHHASATALGGAVVVSGGSGTLNGGGWQGSREVWRWELHGDGNGDGEWEAMPPMPEERWGHRMVELGGDLYVVGGHGETPDTLVYRPDRGDWARVAPIPEVRDHLSVVATDDRIWAIGGRGPGNVARVDIYDPEADVWQRGPDLPVPTSGAAEGFVDGYIYVLGGEDPSLLGGGIVDEHWVLDTRAEPLRWEPAPAPPLAVHGADGAVFGGRMVIVGGASRQGALSVTAWTRTFQIMEEDAIPPPAADE